MGDKGKKIRDKWCRFSPECPHLCTGNYFNNKTHNNELEYLYTGKCKADMFDYKYPWMVSELEVLVLNVLNKEKEQ